MPLNYREWQDLIDRQNAISGSASGVILGPDGAQVRPVVDIGPQQQRLQLAPEDSQWVRSVNWPTGPNDR